MASFVRPSTVDCRACDEKQWNRRWSSIRPQLPRAASALGTGSTSRHRKGAFARVLYWTRLWTRGLSADSTAGGRHVRRLARPATIHSVQPGQTLTFSSATRQSIRSAALFRTAPTSARYAVQIEGSGNITGEIRSDIESIAQDSTLYEETNFDRRVQAIDHLEFNVVERIEGLLLASSQTDELNGLKQEAERVKSQLEEIDANLFRRLRADIRAGACAGTGLKGQIDKY